MIYAQINSGGKLHLAYEAGEGPNDANIVRAGHLSQPLCGLKFEGPYRMTCNLPLGHSCKNCQRVNKARAIAGGRDE